MGIVRDLEIARERLHVAELDAPLPGTADGMTRGDLLPSSEAPPDEVADRDADYREVRRAIGALADDRLKVVLVARGSGWSLQSVADVLGVRSRERARQLEVEALAALRGALPERFAVRTRRR